MPALRGWEWSCGGLVRADEQPRCFERLDLVNWSLDYRAELSMAVQVLIEIQSSVDLSGPSSSVVSLEPSLQT